MKMSDPSQIKRRNIPGTKASVSELNSAVARTHRVLSGNTSIIHQFVVLVPETLTNIDFPVLKVVLNLCISLSPQDFCNWPDEAFEEMDTLAVQQYIQQLIKHEPSEVDTILRMPDGQDEGVWKYEHLRYVILSLQCKVRP